MCRVLFTNMLSLVTLSVIIQNIIMQSVGAPYLRLIYTSNFKEQFNYQILQTIRFPWITKTHQAPIVKRTANVYV
jgi:hypothetical protein